MNLVNTLSKLVTILLLFCYTANSQIIRCNPFYKPYSSTLFLDLYPSATLAVSLRKLRTGYSGSCIRVRRTDNTEQDIGFINNYLDTASLKTFVGANNGFVTTWYDQSSSGNNLIQTTAASQPKIVTSGVINRQSGTACINTATSLFLATSNVLFNGGTISFISAIGSHATANSGLFGNRNGVTGLGYFYSNTAGNYIFGNFGTGGASASITIAQQTKQLSFLTKVSTTNTMWINSTNTNSSTGTYASTTAAFYVGRVGAVGNTGTVVYANGNYFELIGYTTDQTSNRTAMETNLNTYYSIY
jgi:hypothetical protein